MSVQQQGTAPGAWPCRLCGGGASVRRGLKDHLAWCLGSHAANMRMLDDVVARDGQLTQEALVAEATRRRNLLH